MKRGELTDKQRRFVDEYLVDLNATQAAIRAGYSKRGASVRGSELLANRKVAAEVSRRQDERTERTEITQDRVLAELAKLGFSNMDDYIVTQEDGSAHVDLSKLTRDQAAAITQVEVETYDEGSGEGAVPVKRIKFKLADKRGSLDLLGRHLGLFPVKHQHGNDPENPITQPETHDLSNLSDKELRQWKKLHAKTRRGGD